MKPLQASRRGRGLLGLTLFGLCATLAAGCHSGGSSRLHGRSESSATTTATDSATTATKSAAGEAGVLDAYRRYWTTVNTFGAVAAPFDPVQFKNTFSPVVTGPQYDSLFNVFQLDRAKGWVYRGREGNELRPRVTELSGDRAVVEDCADDFGGIFDTRNNVFVEPLTPGQHTRITAVLRFVDGAWKVHTQGGGDERCTV